MTTKEIMELDFRESESHKIMQKALRKIEPLAKCDGEKVPIEKVEKLLFMLQKRYYVETRGVLASCTEDQPLYTITVNDVYDNKIIGNVYGITLYEVMSKAVVLIWSNIKGQAIKKRKEYI